MFSFTTSTFFYCYVLLLFCSTNEMFYYYNNYIVLLLLCSTSIVNCYVLLLHSVFTPRLGCIFNLAGIMDHYRPLLPDTLGR